VSGDGPDWAREAAAQIRTEVAAFMRTAVDFTRAPHRFAREWLGGQRRALNPLGFLATAFGFVGPLRVTMTRIIGGDDGSGSLLGDVLGALLPFAYYVVLGALQHGVLRAFGSRQPLRHSCAMALYAGGGPASAVTVITIALVAVLYPFSHAGRFDRGPIAVALAVALTAAFSVFLITLSAAQAGIHGRDGIRGWHIMLANIVAVAASRLVMGVLDPPGHYGLHFQWGPHHSDGRWHWTANLTD
jgi:hypothetical protein